MRAARWNFDRGSGRRWWGWRGGCRALGRVCSVAVVGGSRGKIARSKHSGRPGRATFRTKVDQSRGKIEGCKHRRVD